MAKRIVPRVPVELVDEVGGKDESGTEISQTDWKPGSQEDLFRSVTPKFFCELFGINHHQRNLWEDQLAIPCGRGRKTIDMFAVGAVLRKICSRRVELSGSTPDMQAAKLRKMQVEIEKLENQIYRARVENEELAKQRLPRPMIMDRLKRMAQIIRGVGERFSSKSRLTGVEAQRMLNKAIEQYDRELEEFKTV